MHCSHKHPWRMRFDIQLLSACSHVPAPLGRELSWTVLGKPTRLRSKASTAGPPAAFNVFPIACCLLPIASLIQHVRATMQCVSRTLVLAATGGRGTAAVSLEAAPLGLRCTACEVQAGFY